MTEGFLYEQLYEYVMRRVADGELEPGDRVPSEKELATRFGVSRITSKRALHQLAEAGVLERHQGRGSFVAARPPPDARHGRVQASPSREAGARCLALVSPDASEVYGLELLCAIEERCAEYGCHLLVRRIGGSQQVEAQAVDALTEHLLDRGHRRVAILSPPVENTSSIEERLAGYEQALRRRGLPAHERIYCTEFHSTLPGSSTADNVRADLDAIRAFVDREPDVTGFVACEYGIAVLLRQVLAQDQTRSRPGCTVTCFDSPATPGLDQPFTHIRQDQREMGTVAVDLLVAQLNGEEVPLETKLPFTLTDPARGHDASGGPLPPRYSYGESSSRIGGSTTDI